MKVSAGRVQCYRDAMKEKVPSVGSRKSRVCATWLKLAMYQAKTPPFGSKRNEKVSQLSHGVIRSSTVGEHVLRSWLFNCN